MLSTIELLNKHGEKFCKLSATHQEVHALWFLINIQFHVLRKEKKLTKVKLNSKISKASGKYASCKTIIASRESTISFAPKTMLEKMAKDPMELLMGSFYTVAHELGHHMAIEKHGSENGSGHGVYWKEVMEKEFGIEASRLHTSEENLKAPNIKHQQARLRDMYELYQNWRLEGVDWSNPLVEKIINGSY